MSRQPRRAALAVVGIATMVALASVGTSGVMADPAGGGSELAAPPPDGSGATDAAQSRHTVTLLTGDQVTVTTHADGHRAIDIEAAPGRSGVAFSQRATEDGRLRVVPADALPLIGAGRIDPGLFDVTSLIEEGYDDASADTLPLIVTYDDGGRTRQRAAAALETMGATVQRRLPSIDGAAVQVPLDSTDEFWQQLTADDKARTITGGIEKIRLDGRVHPQLDHSVGQIGAPDAWDAGVTGDGVKVAVLDTGIDPQHPDVADAVVAAEDFTFNESTVDNDGHGTHVASIVAGRGTASDGRYTGVAPDADLLVGKVLDWFGGYDSWIIAGMEWAVGQGADVVNMSLGGCATDGSDALVEAVNTLTEQSGALFVVAAGNHPSGQACLFPERVASPASADHALAVGSVDKADELSGFSNVGPRAGDGAVKPELTAPGESIVAARAQDTLSEVAVDDHYATLSGTSMAAPHVAGVAALLAQQHSDWAADDLRAALLGSAAPQPDVGVFAQGAGRVDAARAVSQDLFTSPAAVSLGTAAWPHDDDKPITETLTYRNTADEPVTLDLSVTTLGPDGETAPAGVITATPEQITVGAGATASVEVTADTSTGAPDGTYGGWITATDEAGAVAVTTAVGVVQEVESYDLTIDAVDRNGDPAATELTIGDLGAETLRDIQLSGEPVTVRLPAGQYDVNTGIYTPAFDGPIAGTVTLVAHPELELDHDMQVTLDARDGLPVAADVDSDTARPVGERRAFLESYRVVWGISANPDEEPHLRADDSAVLFATPTPEVTSYDYTFGYQTALAEPEAEPDSRRLPRGYNLHVTEDGRIPKEPLRVRDSELIRLDTTLHGQGVDTQLPATLGSWPIDDETGIVWLEFEYDVRMPGKRIDLYSDSPGILWDTQLAYGESESESIEYGPLPEDYRAGRRYDKHWNAAPIGPVARPIFAYGRLWATLTPFASSSPGHSAYIPPIGVDASTTLTVDGEVIGTSDEPDGGFYEMAIPEDTATYEVSTRATRDVGWSVLATEVEATWRVTAEPPEPFVRLPFLALRASGDVDLLGRAPARRPFRLELAVERADGVQPDVRGIELEASFDDGSTWRKVRVRSVADGFVARVPRSPAGAEFVSLRASVEDTDGSRLDQTVIRAYQLAR